MAAETESKLSYITKCRLLKGDGTPCGFQVTDNPLNVTIIGQSNARVENFVKALMQHAAKKHRQAFDLATMHGQMMFAYLIVGMFECQDPAILEMRKQYEERMRRYATPAAVTDAEIDGALAAMQFTMEDPKRRIVKGAMMHLRDYYEGRISQKALDAEKSMLVTP